MYSTFPMRVAGYTVILFLLGAVDLAGQCIGCDEGVRENHPAQTRSMPTALNVLGTALSPCSLDPKTGWFRDGSCRTDDMDHGTHVICARMTAAFLEFSRARGNDLITPRPEHRFPGLKPGDQWCLCATRWREAFDAGVAPLVVLASTHERALQFVKLDELKSYATSSGSTSEVGPRDN